MSVAVHSSRRLLALHFFPCEFDKFIKPTKDQVRKALSNDLVLTNENDYTITINGPELNIC